MQFLAGMGEAGHVHAEAVLKLLADGDSDVRLAAVQFLAGLGEAGHVHAEPVLKL